LQALLSLNKKDLSEVKSYSQPPLLVAKVMEAVMVLKNVEPTWAEAKKQLGGADFLKEVGKAFSFSFFQLSQTMH